MFESTKPNVELIPIKKIRRGPNNHKRIIPEEEAKRRASIEKFGVMQPVRVYKLDLPDKDGCLYGLIEGFGRCRTMEELGREMVPAIIVLKPSDGDIAAMRMTEECIRQARSMLEKVGLVCEALKDDAWTVGELARVWGYTNSTSISKMAFVGKSGTDALKVRLDNGVDLDTAYDIAHLPPERQELLAAMPNIPKREKLKDFLAQQNIPAEQAEKTCRSVRERPRSDRSASCSSR